MADDIVTRIRQVAKEQTTLGQALDVLHVADVIERLRVAGDALAAAHIDDLCDCSQSECVAIRDAHTTWQQVRNG